MAHISRTIFSGWPLYSAAVAILLIVSQADGEDYGLVASETVDLTDDVTEAPSAPVSIGRGRSIPIPDDADSPRASRRTTVTVNTPIHTGDTLHEPSIAAGRLNPALVDVGANGSYNMHIFMSSSGGANFPIVNDVGNFPGMNWPYSSDPVVRADAKTTNFYFVGVGYGDPCLAPTANAIFFTKSTDAGQTWAPVAAVDQTPSGGTVFHDKPWMAPDRWAGSPSFGRIWVNWNKYTGYPCSDTGIPQIQSSVDAGATWTNPVSVFQPSLDVRATWPGEVIALSDGTALAAYVGEPVLGSYQARVVKCTTTSCSLASSLAAVAVPDLDYRFQNLGGTRVNSIPSLAINDIASGNGAVLLVWVDVRTGLGQIRAAVSTTAGQGFQVVGPVDAGANADQFHTSAGWWVDSNGQSYAVTCYYQRVSESTQDINFKCARSSDNGLSWTPVLMTSSSVHYRTQ